MEKLIFSSANRKLVKLKKDPLLAKYLSNKKKIYSLDLLSGWTCPNALLCKSRVVENPTNGKLKIQDGKDCQFRCFSASQEAIFTHVYKNRKHNTKLLKEQRFAENFADLILESIPTNAGIIRYHVSGDFFNLNYMLGSLMAAEKLPNTLFYFYTKSLEFLQYLDMEKPSQGIIRNNFIFTASYGGKQDHLIDELGLRYSKVVFSESEAKKEKLILDNDDTHAAKPGSSFGLLLHGVQPEGSLASMAWYRILKQR